MVVAFKTISKQTVRPSLPTPANLRCLNLSFLDQVAPFIYVSIVLFYPETHLHQHHILKKSLELTLARFYPLAGRLRDDCSIVDCNDRGAEYFEVRVGCRLHAFNSADVRELRLLLPYSNTVSHLGDDRPASSVPLLGVQLTRFKGGGITVGVCLLHKVADASTMGFFLRCWAAITKTIIGGERKFLGDVNGSGGSIVDCTSYFPPVADASGFAMKTYIDEGIESKTVVTKKFVLDAAKISALKKEIAAGNKEYTAVSRVIAVSSFIWGSIIRAIHQSTDYQNTKSYPEQLTEEEPINGHCPNQPKSLLLTSVQGRKVHVAKHVVNLRSKMLPPLPKDSLGSICQLSFGAEWRVDEPINYSGLAKALGAAIVKITDGSVRKMHERNDYLNEVTSENTDDHTEAPEEDERLAISFSSWCGFPYNETDFGWGKPAWVATPGLPFNNFVNLMDSAAGDGGVEALVNLSAEDMGKLDTDTEFNTFLSSGRLL